MSLLRGQLAGQAIPLDTTIDGAIHRKEYLLHGTALLLADAKRHFMELVKKICELDAVPLAAGGTLATLRSTYENDLRTVGGQILFFKQELKKHEKAFLIASQKRMRNGDTYEL